MGPGDLFVDVGAWIGPVSLWALESGAEVIAIEPDPVAAAELRSVLPKGTEIWEGALTAEGGEAHLAQTFEYGDSMSRIADEGIRVKAWTLPEILNGRVPALVTMDVEGHEFELLPTVAPYLAERHVPLQVALHKGVARREWFAGYADVQMSGCDDLGLPTLAVARP